MAQNGISYVLGSRKTPKPVDLKRLTKWKRFDWPTPTARYLLPDASGHCYLLDLPPELRQLIYEWLMAGSNELREKKPWPRTFTSLIELAKTCKGVWEEAVSFMNEVRTYSVDTIGSGGIFIDEGFISHRSLSLAHENALALPKLTGIRRLSITIHASLNMICDVQRTLYALVALISPSQLKHLDVKLEYYESPVGANGLLWSTVLSHDAIPELQAAAFPIDPLRSFRKFQGKIPSRSEADDSSNKDSQVWMSLCVDTRKLMESDMPVLSHNVLGKYFEVLDEVFGRLYEIREYGYTPFDVDEAEDRFVEARVRGDMGAIRRLHSRLALDVDRCAEQYPRNHGCPLWDHAAEPDMTKCESWDDYPEQMEKLYNYERGVEASHSAVSLLPSLEEALPDVGVDTSHLGYAVMGRLMQEAQDNSASGD
ncbi:uncharacterized protein LTR77_003501 [Saxophila tyrrhenica]|uniref:Uncharacterized protein n=1 Tax=Saxophila tyrrhenica TaxID=1690608 RepID=A0AAV9PEI4_9PEZI|nr:hypothetical protein LTR77_003501 [Saxophila tyrrhenica]